MKTIKKTNDILYRVAWQYEQESYHNGDLYWTGDGAEFESIEKAVQLYLKRKKQPEYRNVKLEKIRRYKKRRVEWDDDWKTEKMNKIDKVALAVLEKADK